MEWLFESLLLLHYHFGNSLATLFASRTRLERQGCHRWRQEAKCKYKLTLLDTTFDTFLIHFQDKRHFLFMSFRGDVLVMLSWCICVPFLTIFPPISCALWSVPEVIWTALAWPKHMVWLLSAPRNYKKTEQKSIAIWRYIFSGFWHHFGYMFWRRSDFLEQTVVYKIECEKGAPKRWNKEWWLSPGAPWQPPSCAHFLNNKQQLSKQWTTTIAEV